MPSPGGRVDVVVLGEVDWSNQHQLAAWIEAAWDAQPVRLVLDLRGVTFLGLSTLRVLIGARRRADAEQACLELLTTGEGVRRVLRHLDELT